MYRSKKNTLRRSRIALGLVVLSLSLMLMISVTGVALAAGSVTGLVFRDYNANGVRDAQEPGVGGVRINAYGAAGTIVGTALSDTAQATLGQYTITWTSADTRVRLEFTGLPGTAQQGAFGAGAGSGTSVQFVDAGATNVNYGINRPSDYCLATPNLQLITTCFELGDQNTANPVVVSHNYDGTGVDVAEAGANEVGTTWGVAYKPAPVGSAVAPIIYVSAFAKRQSDYGPGGNGAIYAIQGGVVTTLTTIPGTGATAHNPANYDIDSTFYAAPGKQSLGDMDLSEDGTTLYVINLFNRNLYSVSTATGVATPRGVIGPAACVNGVYRPFGLGKRDGLVYVGGVCTAELGGTAANLQAYVYSFNPATNAQAQVLTFPLNYPRGCTDIDPAYVNTANPGGNIPCRTTAVGSQADWQPWSDVWPNPDLVSGFAPNAGGDEFFAYPQPILAGIEFIDDDMVVSFRDRIGDQLGYRDNGPDGLGGTFPDQLVTVTAGDLLRAGPTGAGTWTLESAAAGSDFGPGPGNANEQGPGDGEFYSGDNFGNAHDETLTGGIVQVAGDNTIAAIVMDPAALFSAGTAWLNNTTGNRARNFTIIPATAPFGKGNGLGDLAATCASAPIEIGNYVWFDADNDGIQDPNEQPLANIAVQLFDPLTNAVIATVTTDAQGRYIFSSDALGTTTANYAYNLPMAENTAYQVRIDTTQPNLTGFTTTIPTAGGAVNAVRNSNGVFNAVTNFSVATVTTGTAGQNDHTIDFGFFAPPYSLGNRVWFDDGRGGGTANDGIQNGTEIGIDGVTVNLLDALGNVIATTTTITGPNGAGFYLFDNLPPGSYIVEIPASNFAVGGVLNGLNSSADAATSGTPNNDVDRDDNGVNLVGGGVRSNPITLGTPPGEPTNELPADIGPQGSGVATNGNSNLTMDFGFFGVVTTYSLGNRVWLDSNNNGLIDPGEPGIGNVVLNLYTVVGGVTSATPLRSTTTTAAGYYLFDNLPAGDYVVEVAPASCAAGGPLSGLANSTGAGQEADPNVDGDSNDNGLDASGTCSVRSDVVTLGPGTVEPAAEADLGPQGSGIAPDNQSNLTVDFGYWGTPPVSTPPPLRLDPAIVKAVDPAFAQPGEDVNWTITITNPHTVAINNVSFEDNFPSQLEIIRATVDSTAGSLVVTGNKVSYSISVLNPGESVHVRVFTRIRPGTPVPFIITNTVNLTGAYVGSASATVISAGSLPATGFDPSWRIPLLAGMGVLVVLFGVGLVRLRQRGYNRS